jgi:hypothetical protein
MEFRGKFLAVESSSFNDRVTGKIIPYWRLHAWVPGALKYKMLKCSEDTFKKIQEQEVKFGDDFTCTVEEGANEKGIAFLRIIRW